MSNRGDRFVEQESKKIVPADQEYGDDVRILKRCGVIYFLVCFSTRAFQVQRELPVCLPCCYIRDGLFADPDILVTSVSVKTSIVRACCGRYPDITVAPPFRVGQRP